MLCNVRAFHDDEKFGDDVRSLHDAEKFVNPDIFMQDCVSLPGHSVICGCYIITSDA